jgi:hypothetical protein
MGGQMLFLAEQHLVAAKLVRENGAWRSGAELELYIKKSNSFVACVRLAAKDRGGISSVPTSIDCSTATD